MYKVQSDLSQRRARQLWLADLQGSNWAQLSPDEQRANLVRAIQKLAADAASMPPKSEAKVENGLRQQELMQLIRELRPKIRLRQNEARSVECHFIDIAKQRLAPGHFKSMMREAVERELAARSPQPAVEGSNG